MIKEFLLLFLLAFSASAFSLDFEVYQKLTKKSDKASVAIVNSHLDAIATSFVTYERMVSKFHRKRLLCMPNNVLLTPAAIQKAVDMTYARYRVSRDMSKFPVSELAFMGLVAKYPCESLTK